MLASEIITEEWLVDVLDDSMEMDWTTADGARAIMSALKAGLIRLPQTGGQIAHVASTKDRVLAVEILAQAFERFGDNRSATMVREAEANSKLRKSYCTPLHMEVALDAIAAALARPHSAVAPAGDGVEAGKVLDDIVPLSIASTWNEAERRNVIRAMQQYAALARPRAAVGEREAALQADVATLFEQHGNASCDECGAPLFDHDQTDTDEAETVAICAGHRHPDALTYAYRLALQSPPAKVD